MSFDYNDPTIFAKNRYRKIEEKIKVFGFMKENGTPFEIFIAAAWFNADLISKRKLESAFECLYQKHKKKLIKGKP